MNKEWHQKHPMPIKASISQRIEWHMAHQQHCACRPIPVKLLEVMKKDANGKRENRHPGRPK